MDTCTEPEDCTDEVDRIVSAWRDVRPDIDVAPMEILSRVTRLSRQLDRKRKAVFSSHGLDVWAFDVLSALRRAGEPYQLSPKALMEQMLVTSGTMTNRIDRLVTAGWVSRHRDPADRRGVLVRLTPAGRGKVDGALADFLALESRLLAELQSEERGTLATSLRHLLACVEAVEDLTPGDEDSVGEHTADAATGDSASVPGDRHRRRGTTDAA